MEIISDAEGRQKAMVMADALLALPLLLMSAIQGGARLMRRSDAVGR